MSYRDKTHKVIFTCIINSNIPQLIANIDLVSLIFATCHFPITELMNYIWSNFEHGIAESSHIKISWSFKPHAETIHKIKEIIHDEC